MEEQRSLCSPEHRDVRSLSVHLVYYQKGDKMKPGGTIKVRKEDDRRNKRIKDMRREYLAKQHYTQTKRKSRCTCALHWSVKTAHLTSSPHADCGYFPVPVVTEGTVHSLWLPLFNTSKPVGYFTYHQIITSNKTGDVRITQHSGGFAKPLLQWKNKYVLRISVCVCVCVALVIQHTKRVRRIIL